MGEKFTNTHTPSHLNKHSLLNITFQYILRETNFTTNSTVKRILNNAVPQKLLRGTPASINQYMYTEITKKSEIYISLPQQLQCLIKSLIARPVSWVKIMKHVFKPHIKSLHLVTKERQLVHPQLT